MKRYQNFADMLKTISQEEPEHPVFFFDMDGRKAVTWSSFEQMVQERTAVLAESSKTCIGILCENTPACIAEIFAAVLAGRQIVLLDAAASDEILKMQIQAGDAALLWGDQARINELNACLTKGCTDGKGKILFFTSGTAGAAKAVVLTDASLMQSAYNGSCLLPLKKEDILLNILPLNHVFGMVCGLLWGMSNRAPVALGRGPRHYLDDCSFYQPTAVSAVPMLLGFLLKFNCLNPALKQILIGAGDCPEEYFEQAEKKGIHVSFGYGLTETSSGVALSTGSQPLAMTVCPDDQITIASDGEILIKAPTCMMLGYYKNQKETDDVLTDGILHTGDLGYFDAEGKLYVMGRKKEMLVLLDGTKIFLPEYEKPIKALLKTDELAVVLHDHVPVLVTAEVLGSPQAVLSQLSSFMKTQPRGHQLTAVIALHHPMPRTATGKIRHWEIQKEIEESWQTEKRS